jgi:hypothetical protein
MGEQYRIATDAEVATLAPRLDYYLAPVAILTEFVELIPFVDVLASGGAGCASGHVVYVPETTARQQVYVTINDPHGCAQGCWHEYGHLKLESMGIGIETHDDRLLLNSPDEVYASAMRTDKPRPLSAVLHGLYAWLQFTQNDYQLYMTKKIDHDEFVRYAAHNFPKLLANLDVLRRHARWSIPGQQFATEIYQWTEMLCAKGLTACL